MFSQVENDGWKLSCKMAICIENDIIILSSHEMTTKWVKSGEVEDMRSLLIVFTHCGTFYVDIDYITIDFDHRINEISLALL